MRAPLLAALALSVVIAAPAAAATSAPDPAKSQEKLGGTPYAADAHLPEDGRAALIRERAVDPARAQAVPVRIAAADAGAPTFTAPESGAAVGGQVVVSATSAAAWVRFSAGSWQALAPVEGGTASSTFDSYGMNGSQVITAEPCDDATTCAAAPATISVTVSNPAIAVTHPGSGSTVGSSFVATVNAPGGGVRFFLDGVPVGDVAVSPYSRTVDTSTVDEGAHDLTAIQCDAAFLACAGQAAPSVPITVKHALAPVVTSVSPTPFSPNGDGRRDTTTVTYALETAQTGTWRVLDASGSLVRGPGSLPSGAAGTHSFTYVGTANGGSKLPTGSYILQVRTSKAVVDGTITGLAERAFQIDVTPPVVYSRTASPSTFYPVSDGYRDTTDLRGTLNERTISTRVQVLNSKGGLVRTFDLGVRSAGPTYARWNGRTAGGTLLAAGTYYYRFLIQDAAGNRTTTSKSSFVLSHKKLVAKSGTTTVTPDGSDIDYIIGYCSEIYRSATWSGGFEYLSDFYWDYTCDPANGDDVAATQHRVTLPSAIKYGAVRVAAYGQRDLPGYADYGFLLYENKYGDVSNVGASLGPAAGWYSAPSVSGPSYLQGRSLVWWAGALDGNYYDIRYFRVTYTYYVLG